MPAGSPRKKEHRHAMKFFSSDLRRASPDHAELVRRYELASTLVDFLAAVWASGAMAK